jgi:transcriptional repressor NrdR
MFIGAQALCMAFYMKCPFCGYTDSKVVDSRPADEGATIRRRRICLSCGKRFTSYETVEAMPVIVVKNDGSRQPFDRQKLFNSLLRAFSKRTITLEELEGVVNNIEQGLQNNGSREVDSSQIGEMAMEELKGIDEVAYIRFTSVYRKFRDIESFMKEMNSLLEEK